METIRIAHIAGGALSLLALCWVIASRKGGRAHRSAGWLFIAGMTTTILSGAVSCIRRLLDDRAGNDAGAWFLIYVSGLTAFGIVSGLRSLQTRDRTGPERAALDLAAPVLLLGASLALAVFGARERQLLFIAFAFLGAALSVAQLRFWLRAPASRRAWLGAHIRGMGTAAIGAVTAFVVVNAARFAPSLPTLLVWTLPGIIGAILLTLANRRHGISR